MQLILMSLSFRQTKLCLVLLCIVQEKPEQEMQLDLLGQADRAGWEPSAPPELVAALSWIRPPWGRGCPVPAFSFLEQMSSRGSAADCLSLSSVSLWCGAAPEPRQEQSPGGRQQQGAAAQEQCRAGENCASCLLAVSLPMANTE